MKETRRKITIIVLFVMLIFFTLFAINKLFYDELNSYDEILGNLMNNIITVIFVLPVILLELELMFNTLYFFCSKKTKLKTVFNIVTCLNSFSIIIATINLGYPFCSLSMKVSGNIWFITVMLYLVLRSTYIILAIKKKI